MRQLAWTGDLEHAWRMLRPTSPKQWKCLATAESLRLQHQIRCSIVVSISACHAEDPGSIPGGGVCPSLWTGSGMLTLARVDCTPPRAKRHSPSSAAFKAVRHACLRQLGKPCLRYLPRVLSCRGLRHTWKFPATRPSNHGPSALVGDRLDLSA